MLHSVQSSSRSLVALTARHGAAAAASTTSTSVSINKHHRRSFASDSSGSGGGTNKNEPLRDMQKEFLAMLEKPMENPGKAAYKCHEFYQNDKYTYYDLEAAMTQYRLPQPSPDKPDEPRDVKTS